ncbi:MAG TPA: multiheme c-type cytochrome [Polyangia bacterium]
MRSLGILALAGSFGLLGGGCRAEARAGAGERETGAERVVRIVATAEVKGTTEPCGCTSDPLGGVARVATLARGGLWVDAGGLLYDREGISAAMRPQADLKAERLARIYGEAGALVGLGPDDLARGPSHLSPPREAANVTGLPMATVAPVVRNVDGIKVGVFGVVSPERMKEVGVQAQAAEPAARAAILALRKQGAQVIVALLGMNRGEARGLLRAVPGIGFGIVGAEVGEGMAEAEPVGGGFLVAPADLGRRVATIELHVRNGKVALTLFAGEAARRREIEEFGRRISTLTLQLASWRHDPTADQSFVTARAAELEQLTAKRTALKSAHPTPPRASYFTYALTPVDKSVAAAPKVVAELRALDRQIGQVNLASAKKLPPLSPEPGKASYVGMAACAKCHQKAVDFWQHTVHAQAWKTLVSVDKQYNYDCTGCHVTGWMKPGGANLATVEKRGLVNVQCEVCHGPGSIHVAEAGLEDPPSLTRRPADRFCADNCHTKEHSDTFQLVPYLRDILGKGHGEKLRASLGQGVTGHELRQKALQAAAH